MTARRRGRGAALSPPPRQFTPRTTKVCEVLYEQRVMTTHQLASIVFDGGLEVAKHRLLVLHRLDVVSRFRPLVLLGEGSAPFHYTLGLAGAPCSPPSGRPRSATWGTTPATCAP